MSEAGKKQRATNLSVAFNQSCKRMMKILPGIILLYFLSADHCFSQNTIPAALHVMKIPPEGILLDKGWTFKLGDSADFAKPGYDDKAWQSVNPALDIHDSLPQLPKQGICWFRIYLSIESATRPDALALIIQQSGASEIFLNGVLIRRFGTVDERPAAIKAFDPSGDPMMLSGYKNGLNLLAVRYAVQPGVLYTTIFETVNPALRITIQHADVAMHVQNWHISIYLMWAVFVIGVFVLAFVLHLAFYIFNPQQKANLSFTLFALFFIPENVIRVWFFLYGHDVSAKFYVYNLCFALLSGSNLFLYMAIRQLTAKRLNKVFWTVVILSIVSTILIVPRYGWGWLFGGLISLFIQLDIMRLALISVKKGKEGARIIAWGAIGFFVFFTFFYVDGVVLNDSLGLGAWRLVLYVLSVLSIPVATSIYLGLDFAFINRSLQKKLVEVEQLSLKTIEQEKEKQDILSSQKETLEQQVEQRTVALNQSLEELKSTQAQLIQSEKLASLGQLTAGIAHEIQNPLNFVNNFSEVNRELAEELNSELAAGNSQSAAQIANDIKENSEKINHHGRRAEAIVKGMLQHSRTSAGTKEQTDINALCDEYLRLSYHGFRAKNKAFNAELKTDFDETMGKVNIVSQDIGRVLLNLFNNAFYAVNEKRKMESGKYEPAVAVSTKKVTDTIEIKVSDNGNGISQNVLDKIFQPFFTTKPTGQGTGLGLSLAYDIVKAHGGEIVVESEEGKRSSFIIQLPHAV